MKVVQTSIKHLSQLRDLWHHVFGRFGYSEEVYESIFFDLNAYGWVCIHESKVIGGLMSLRHSGALEITSIVVLAENRRTGIGEKLVKEVMSFAERREIREVFFHTQPTNHAAIHLFARFGFQFTQADGIYHTGEMAHRYRVLL